MSEAIRELVAPSIIGLYKTEVIRTLSCGSFDRQSNASFGSMARIERSRP